MDMALLTKGPSNIHHHHDYNHQMITTKSQVDMQSTSFTSTSLSPDSGDAQACPTGKWASKLLRECTRAISDKDTAKLNHLLWMVNEMASPYGDCDQKLGSYFLQALFCKATSSGHRCFKTLTHVAKKSQTFDSARKLMLKFQELSSWTTFGHVASNGAILEAFEGETKLHIIDISNTLCTQWPTLLEALASRSNETPSLRLTVVVTSASVVKSVMKEVGQRMEKFARLMGVPFELSIVSELTKGALGVREGEAVAVNCMGALRRVRVEGRGGVVGFLKSLNPKIVTVVEEEADFTSTRNEFGKCFEECLRFYTTYFEMLEESFPPTSNERLVLERECSKTIVRVLACDAYDDDDDNDNDDDLSRDNGGFGECERREKGRQWCERFNEEFSPFGFSLDVLDDVRALLKRYRGGWGLVVPQQDHEESGAYLSWKDEPVVWAAAWKPS